MAPLSVGLQGVLRGLYHWANVTNIVRLLLLLIILNIFGLIENSYFIYNFWHKYFRPDKLINHLRSVHTPKQYLLLPDFKESWKFSKPLAVLFCIHVNFNADRFDSFRFDICKSVHHSTIYKEKSNRM
jgi:hypothetical protein